MPADIGSTQLFKNTFKVFKVLDS